MLNKKSIYKDVALLHIENIESGFLPSLGLKFLTLMYKCIDEADFTILEVEYYDGELKGFISGTNGKKSLYKEMLKHPLSLLLCLSPIIFDYKKFFKIINILKHMASNNRLEFPNSELLTICVNKKFQRQGVANNLYEKLKNYFREQNIKTFSIVVGKSLDSNKFYLKQGAYILGLKQVHPGTDSNIYIQEV